jgi:hypothetical protein
MTDPYQYNNEPEEAEELPTTGSAPDDRPPLVPTYKYYNDKFQEVHLVQALSVPDDQAALEYFHTVYNWFEEDHPDRRVKYVAVKHVGSEKYEMLAYEYDCDADEVTALGG